MNRNTVDTEKLLTDCQLCPRECGVDRLKNADGICATGRFATVCAAFAHHGEESCLSGTYGSGTIFFGQCNLRCVFCQNWDVSHEERGEECRPDKLAGLMLALQKDGCHNINFVTPTHVVPQILEALELAKTAGLKAPVVYNCGGYEKVETLRLLEGYVDIYMPDFKFWRTESAERYCNAPDYPERAKAALSEMHRQVGDLAIGRDGLARRGLLVRHLVMPGLVSETGEITKWLSTELSPDTFINIMGQYRPEHRVGKGSFPEINRRPLDSEMDEAFRLARSAGLRRWLTPALPAPDG